MIAIPTTAEVLELRMQLLDNGWRSIVPSSPRDKGCSVIGWPSIETNEFYLTKWAWSHPAHTNTASVGNRDHFGVDIDVVSDPDLAHRIQALAFEHLGPTPFIRVGLWPKRLLVYQKLLETLHGGRDAKISEPVIASAAFKAANGSDDGLEILSVGKQFTIYGIHAGAGQPYQWIGECNPLDDTPDAAPLVSQKQVDAFLAAVEAVMPLVRAGSGGGNGGDGARHVNSDGQIDDGREGFLRDCIWKAAHEIEEAGNALTAEALAGRGWELFEEHAWNGDGKYSLSKQAMEKARLLIRRLNDGRVKLGGTTSATAPTHAGTGTRPVTGKRDELRARFQNLISAAHQLLLGNPDPVHA